MFIALLTDFGTQDYYVGALKGAILSINPSANVVDISHDISPQNIKSASFVLKSCYQNFPAKTIFVAVVDPGVGSLRKAILVETDKYFFVAPDNGLLSFVFESGENFRVFELTNRKYFAENVSHTFHGRDIFAPVAAHLSNGIAAEMYGNQIDSYVLTALAEKKGAAEIIHIDRFGNLVTNLRQETLPENFEVLIGATRINKLCRFYAEAAEGELIMIFGSSGFLEISAVGSSAAEILQLNRKTKILVKPI